MGRDRCRTSVIVSFVGIMTAGQHRFGAPAVRPNTHTCVPVALQTHARPVHTSFCLCYSLAPFSTSAGACSRLAVPFSARERVLVTAPPWNSHISHLSPPHSSALCSDHHVACLPHTDAVSGEGAWLLNCLQSCKLAMVCCAVQDHVHEDTHWAIGMVLIARQYTKQHATPGYAPM